VASIFVLSKTNVLSHQVATTCKRLVVIVSSVYYFGNEISGNNAIGIFIA
jgi:hypothetical protein